VTPEIALALATLVGAIALLVSGRVRPDVVALLIVLVLVASGLLTPTEAFSGFASPSVIAVASLFVVSAGLFQTGVASRIGGIIVGLAGSNHVRLVGVLMLGVALLSAAMNDVAAVAVLLPVAVGIARQSGIAPSRLLLPLAYGAVMGGTLTLIGTPPNLIVSDMLADRGFSPLSFFEITVVGAPLVAVGTLFMVTVGHRLLPERNTRDRMRRMALPEELIDIYHLPEHIFALSVPAGSAMVGHSLAECQIRNGFALTVLGVVRESECLVVPDPAERLQARDRLLVEGGPRRLDRVARAWGLEAEIATDHEAELLLANDTGLVEVTLAPRSPFEGLTLRELHLREKFGVAVLAIWRGGEPIERNIGDIPLSMGDVLLVQAPWRRIRLLRRDPGLIVLLGDDEVPRRTRKAPWAIAILLAMVAVTVAGVVPISVAALGAALLVILTGCLRIEEAQRAIEWKVVLLVGGILPLGLAMEKSGASQWVADAALSPTTGMGLLALLAVVCIATVGLNLAMSNYATTVLLAPIAFAMADRGGMDPRPFVLAVALSSSVAFASPIAHQSNLLVMGPGDYRFSDYVRAGLPLSLVACLVIVVGLWALS
jgi:di/tricarboxylate transporter